MTLAQSTEGLVVHFPADPNRFEFDEEVSDIFPEMARRSIPLFYETHRLHAYICKSWMQQDEVDVLDVGASRGAFLTELRKLYHLPREGVSIRATDISQGMVEHLQKDFPFADVAKVDASSCEFLMDHRTYDIINCTYVLQFVERSSQVRVLTKLARMLKPGGVMFLGQKLDSSGPAGRILHDQYIRFRLEEGYTVEEIEAKTRALANSMWPMREENITHYLNGLGLHVQETSRWTVFNNYMCTKGL